MNRALLVLVLSGGLFVSCTAGPQERAAAAAACCPAEVAPATPLPDKSLYQLASSWTNDFGQSMKLEALRGHVQVVVLFFAQCTYACPVLLHDMQRLEEALPAATRAKVHFTLVTIDPERDTPASLQAFRKGRKLGADRWHFLQGDPNDTLELAAVLGVKYKREANGGFAHSNLITVLDPEGEVALPLVGLNQEVTSAAARITTLAQAGAAKAR